MVDVDRHAECAAAFGVELVAQIERLLERVDTGAVGCIHRVQRLDRERDADASRIRKRRRDAVAHVAARGSDVLVRGRAVERAGQATDDEHEAGRVQRLRFVDGAPVVG